MIKCKLLKKEIDEGVCVSIVDVCDGAVKEVILQEEIIKQTNWKKVCKTCEYHEM